MRRSERRWENIFGTVVNHLDTRCGIAKRLARFILRERLLELHIDALRVGPHHGHADAGSGDADRVVAQDFVCLLYHLHFFLIVPVVTNVRVVRENVEGILVGEDVLGGWSVGKHVASLLLELVHGGLAGAAGRLVGGNDHTLDRGDTVQWGSGHESDNGAAVGIGNDVFRSGVDAAEDRAVHLGDHERDAIGHAEGAAVVDNGAALAARKRGVVFRYATASAEEGEVNIVEGAFSELLRGYGGAVERNLGPGRACAGKELHTAVLEVALLHHLHDGKAERWRFVREELVTGERTEAYAEELTPDGAGDAHDRHPGPVGRVLGSALQSPTPPETLSATRPQALLRHCHPCAAAKAKGDTASGWKERWTRASQTRHTRLAASSTK